MSEYATIIQAVKRGYVCTVVRGTIHRYHPSNKVTFRRPTAKWAKAAGDRWIAKQAKADRRHQARRQHAREVTGYEVADD